MTQHTKKSANHTVPHHKKPQSEFQGLKAVQQAEETVLEMEREGVKNVMQATQSMNKAASECVAVCSDNISACLESGNKASQAAQNMGGEVMECCNRTLSDFAEISKETLSCRSLGDMVEMQSKAVQQLSDNYFSAVDKLTGMCFGFWSQAMEPFGECSASVTKRMRKALAA